MLVLAASAPTAAWTTHDSWLLALVGISTAVVVVLISWAKVHAFLALTAGAFLVSLLSGHAIDQAADAFTNGMGSTTGNIGALIILGAILGRMLADSGGIDQIVQVLTRFGGPKRLTWSITLVAAILGLPMFFEVGFVMLVPVVLQMARRGGHPILKVGIPAMAGLATVHALVPPHPGPLIAIAAVHAPIGLTMLYGLVVAVPTAIVVGPLFTAYIWPRVKAEIPQSMLAAFTTGANDDAAHDSSDGEPTGTKSPADGPNGSAARPSRGIAALVAPAGAAVASAIAAPPAATPVKAAHPAQAAAVGDEASGHRKPRFWVTIGTILLPVVLMVLKAVCDSFDIVHGALYTTLEFLGTPLIALLLTVLLSLVTLGYATGASRAQVHTSLTRSFPSIAGVLAIVAAGGGYSAALQSSGVNASIALASRHLHIPLLLLAWLVAALMRTVMGSGTVATVAAAGIIGPLAHGLDSPHAALLALAIGSGAAFLGHVNDAAFWMFKEYFGLSVRGTLRTWTVGHTLLSLTSLGTIALLSAVV